MRLPESLPATFHSSRQCFKSFIRCAQGLRGFIRCAHSLKSSKRLNPSQPVNLSTNQPIEPFELIQPFEPLKPSLKLSLHPSTPISLHQIFNLPQCSMI